MSTMATFIFFLFTPRKTQLPYQNPRNFIKPEETLMKKGGMYIRMYIFDNAKKIVNTKYLIHRRMKLEKP